MYASQMQRITPPPTASYPYPPGQLSGTTDSQSGDVESYGGVQHRQQVSQHQVHYRGVSV
jgi:hypothetical protein